jgi:hypothetical protein
LASESPEIDKRKKANIVESEFSCFFQFSSLLWILAFAFLLFLDTSKIATIATMAKATAIP